MLVATFRLSVSNCNGATTKALLQHMRDVHPDQFNKHKTACAERKLENNRNTGVKRRLEEMMNSPKTPSAASSLARLMLHNSISRSTKYNQSSSTQAER